MKSRFLLTASVLALTTPSLAQTASSTVTLSLSVGRSCLLVSGSAFQTSAPLVLKCNSGSAAPQSPLEVVAAPIADWQLTGHERSPDGGELFTYTQRNTSAGVAASVDFY